MKAKVFSERHDRALREKKIRLSLRVELRRSIYSLLMRYSTWGGWDNEENFTRDNVVSGIISRRGWRSLQYWDGKNMTPAETFEEFIEKGTPHHILDTLELFLEEVDNKKRIGFVSELNNLFDIHHSNLRYFRGEFFIIDSAYIESHVLAQAQQLLDNNNFSGALQEFLDARSAYTGKDYKRAILMANHAFESTLKGVLGIKGKKTGELIKRICKDGVIPSYYEGFLGQFYEFLCIVPVTRDNEAGHGQGKEITAVNPSLAELAIHLSGSLIVFLIKRHMERTPPVEDDDIPF